MATHPDFERYKAFFQAGQYDEALATLETLFAAFPQSVSLHWHRALCLEKLDRYDDMAAALDAFLDKQPDYTPAILKRVEYSEVWLEAAAPYPQDPDEEGIAASERTARQQAAGRREALERERATMNEAALRHVLEREPDQAEALYRLSGLLRFRLDEARSEASDAEARAMLDKAISLAPDVADYRLARAELRRGEAYVHIDDEAATPDPNIVTTMLGMHFRRDLLTQAAEDYDFCWKKGGEPRHAMQQAGILHDLGRFDEALGLCDEVLATLPADDPRRELILARRARSENNGAGEREEMARLLEAGVEESPPGKDRTHAEHMAAQAMLGAAEAIRRGVGVSEAVSSHVSDDPETMAAMNIARQLIAVANEPPPQLEAVNPAAYPAYQRKHCDATERAATKIGLQKIADAEARALFNMLGSHVLLRVFSNVEGDIGMASFAMKPKRQGLIIFLVMLLTGKWKVQRMVECVSQFEDGTLITTQPESISPFEYGGKIHMNKLARDADVGDIYQAHAQAVAAFRAAHPEVRPMIVKDLAGVESRWIAGQQSKAAYRKSVGYATDNELRRLLGAHFDRFADKVRAHLHAMAGE